MKVLDEDENIVHAVSTRWVLASWVHRTQFFLVFMEPNRASVGVSAAAFRTLSSLHNYWCCAGWHRFPVGGVRWCKVAWVCEIHVCAQLIAVVYNELAVNKIKTLMYLKEHK
jgi:hypothetical protein